MKLSVYIPVSWILLAASTFAYSVEHFGLSLNSQKLYNAKSLPSEVIRVGIEKPKDALTFTIKLASSERPHQSILLFSDENGLDYAVFPDYNAQKHSLAIQIAVSSLPTALVRQGKITASLVIASGDDVNENIHTKVAELTCSDELRETTKEKQAERFGVLPEIHHIFKQDESTVNAIVPLAFSAVAGVLTLVLFVVWSSIFGENNSKSSGGTYKTGFLVALVAVEHTFLRYYLGASIFTTISHVLLLVAPSVFLGSKALNVMAKSRAA
ncbi:Oligosaccharyltransferase subunit Ribophorin II family protein [Clavispora lusitaniae]|uniref:Oligosaccharyltransferase subunit Ribophorin II family protein n=1 Tax=Clavispora lusitaniae TaxID=36911 RepID=UPI00202C08BD|nr:Oligosaccharyltransferase subunit Ribophorin II family protein [Clavispora lusitaniae]